MGFEGIMDGEEDDTHHAKSSPTSSIEDSSTVSNGLSLSSSSSISDMGDDDDDDDASSSLTPSPSNYSSSNGPLCDLSGLMAQLPIKRGLSKFYQGKSQSFTSLSRVKSMEDLPKRETTRRRRKLYTLPKPIISKKIISRGQLPFSSSYFPSTRGSFVVSSCRPPMIPLQKNLGC